MKAYDDANGHDDGEVHGDDDNVPDFEADELIVGHVRGR